VRRPYLCITSLKRDINFSNVYATLELGKGESPELNIASQENVPSEINLLKSDDTPVVLSTVKAELPEVYCSLSPRIGIRLGRNGTYKIFPSLCDGEGK